MVEGRMVSHCPFLPRFKARIWPIASVCNDVMNANKSPYLCTSSHHLNEAVVQMFQFFCFIFTCLHVLWHFIIHIYTICINIFVCVLCELQCRAFSCPGWFSKTWWQYILYDWTKLASVELCCSEAPDFEMEYEAVISKRDWFTLQKYFFKQ